MFIEVSAHTCIKICVCTVSKKIFSCSANTVLHVPAVVARKIKHVRTMARSLTVKSHKRN
jgi:hypothetical protein